MTIRVAIVSDSALLRSGLATLLAADPELVVVDVAGASRAPEELSAASHEPDVIVWAHQGTAADALPGDGRQLDAGEEDARAPAVVLLANGADRATARRAFRMGVHALLPLDADAATVLAAVHAARAGLLALPRALGHELVTAAAVPDDALAAGAGPPLTAREREVLALLAQGLANKAIAPRLGISEHTVKAHVAAIYDKLHATNRAEAVVAAARRGLVML